jgi:hypothetical protein
MGHLEVRRSFIHKESDSPLAFPKGTQSAIVMPFEQRVMIRNQLILKRVVTPVRAPEMRQFDSPQVHLLKFAAA